MTIPCLAMSLLWVEWCSGDGILGFRPGIGVVRSEAHRDGIP